METNLLSALELAKQYVERIRTASSDEERRQFAEEWHRAYAAFSPEQKAEAQPLLDKISDRAMARIAKMDALIADFKEKHPSLTHLFDEK